jgi:hypothetical protein
MKSEERDQQVKRTADERGEQRKWLWLRSEIKPGLKADESEFVALDAGKIIKEARARRKAHGG